MQDHHTLQGEALLSILAVRHVLACRPDYKKLGVLKQQFPDVPILALTATATRRVCQDLMEILRISACETFHTSVDRPNLYYSVRCVICQVISMVLMPRLRDILHSRSPVSQRAVS